MKKSSHSIKSQFVCFFQAIISTGTQFIISRKKNKTESLNRNIDEMVIMIINSKLTSSADSKIHISGNRFG